MLNSFKSSSSQDFYFKVPAQLHYAFTALGTQPVGKVCSGLVPPSPDNSRLYNFCVTSCQVQSSFYVQSAYRNLRRTLNPSPNHSPVKLCYKDRPPGFITRIREVSVEIILSGSKPVCPTIQFKSSPWPIGTLPPFKSYRSLRSSTVQQAQH